MRYFEINLDLPLKEQIAALRTAVEKAEEKNKRLRLVGYRRSTPWMYEEAPVISDSVIKALMVKFHIDQYVERNEQTQNIKNQPVKFTYDAVSKTKSNFLDRHFALILPATFILGGVSLTAAGVLGAAFLGSLMLGPVGFAILVAAGVIGCAVIPIISVVLNSIEQAEINAQQAEIREGNKALAFERVALKEEVSESVGIEIDSASEQLLNSSLTLSAQVKDCEPVLPSRVLTRSMAAGLSWVPAEFSHMFNDAFSDVPEQPKSTPLPKQ